MPKKRTPNSSSTVDIFQVLTETAEKEKKKRRDAFLAPLGVKEFFSEGEITINKRTCKGVECKLCIKACPTNALFWGSGEVGITEELCIYCGACVLNCIVDDCIKVARKRPGGSAESFSRAKDFVMLQHGINGRKRSERIQDIFLKPEDYINRYGSNVQKS